MIDFTLKYRQLIERTLSDSLIIINTNEDVIIRECIDIFNSQIHWDDMFTIDIAHDRLSYGDKFFVGYHEGKIFGYCWLGKNDDDIFIIYNVFSKETEIKRKYGATDMLYYVIKNHTFGIITAEVDEWNTKSINMFKKLGFKSHV